MLERVSTKAGPIIKYNGKAISSVINPAQEAERWAAHQEVCEQKQVVVLGVGCGYHLKALSNSNPDLKIIVVDNSMEMIRFAKAQTLKRCKNIEYIHIDTLEDSLDQVANFINLNEPFKLLEFRARTVHDKDFFEDLKSELLGHTLSSAKKYLAIHGIECASSIPRSQKTEEASVHLKKVLNTVHIESVKTEDARQMLLLARSLGEMIL